MYFKNELFGLARVRISEVQISEGLLYHENNGTIYLRCTLAKQKGCIGLAKIDTADSLLEMTKTHNHSHCEHITDNIILTNRIKRAAEFSTDNLREVFNKECRDSQGASSLTFKKLESTLVKLRRLLGFVKIVQTN